MEENQNNQKKGLERLEWLEKREGCMFRRFESFSVRAAAEDGGEQPGELWVEGVAATLNVDTVLYSYDGIEYKERIDGRAFEGADLTNVIFNYNHGGKVVARTRNSTLQVWVESDGLRMRARLDGTEEGRKLYEEIKGGYIDQMSFAFTIAERAYNEDTHTRTILKVKKVYDVSAVDIPAYDTTSISARNSFSVEIEKEERVAAAASLRKEVIKSEIELTTKIYGGT